MKQHLLRLNFSTGEKFMIFVDPGIHILALKSLLLTEYKKHCTPGPAEVQITQICDKDDFVIHQELQYVALVSDIFKVGDVISIKIQELKDDQLTANGVSSAPGLLQHEQSSGRSKEDQHKRKRDDKVMSSSQRNPNVSQGGSQPLQFSDPSKKQRRDIQDCELEFQDPIMKNLQDRDPWRDGFKPEPSEAIYRLRYYLEFIQSLPRHDREKSGDHIGSICLKALDQFYSRGGFESDDVREIFTELAGFITPQWQEQVYHKMKSLVNDAKNFILESQGPQIQ